MSASADNQFFFGKPWEDRFAMLLNLPAGWSEDPASVPVSEQSLSTADRVLSYCQDAGYDLPGIFPVPDAPGGVLLEWSSPNAVTNIEITNTGSVELFTLLPHSQVNRSVYDVNDFKQITDFIDETRYDKA